MRKICFIILSFIGIVFWSCDDQKLLQDSIEMNLPSDLPELFIPGQTIHFVLHPTNNYEKIGVAELNHVEVEKDGQELFSRLPRTSDDGFTFRYIVRSEDLGKNITFTFTGVLNNTVMASSDFSIQVIDSYDQVGFFKQSYTHTITGDAKESINNILLDSPIRTVVPQAADLTVFQATDGGRPAGIRSPDSLELSPSNVTQLVSLGRLYLLDIDNAQTLTERIISASEDKITGQTSYSFDNAGGIYSYSTRFSHAGIIQVESVTNRNMTLNIYGLYIKE
ncbi:hypothetical protein [Aureibacter tunicatorum]|uniref:Uncharacterized protein n=1 Tax=Aureibacter tunicatorum TaxID=866807 RepID=A0AAE4BRD4_9BACT|nr:hypothetical protein [Aureibacter tunicatorum]MDR6237132.1 hypothetical protein [Aureibacter tunicatorum]BDD06124.1 hypothetical protein AUTU_36070 [Aureibacter tunicatorum]